MSNTENKNDLEQDTNSVSEFVNDNTDKTKSGIDNTTDKTQSGVNNTTDKIQSGIDKQSENVSSGVDKLNSSFQDIAGELFTTNNLLILIGFLGVYFGFVLTLYRKHQKKYNSSCHRNVIKTTQKVHISKKRSKLDKRYYL